MLSFVNVIWVTKGHDTENLCAGEGRKQCRRDIPCPNSQPALNEARETLIEEAWTVCGRPTVLRTNHGCDGRHFGEG